MARRQLAIVSPESRLAQARGMLAELAESIARLGDRLDENFSRATQLILDCKGRLVVSGMGKSGLVGRKMSSTFACTGTPSLWLHPAEAQHGDLGMLVHGDVALLLSYSGETDEVLRLVSYCEDVKIPMIAIVGRLNSTLARHATVALDGSVEREACPLNLAPTSSSLAALALGDALAMSVMSERGFQPHDFARYHPGGSLGKALLTRVRDAMRCKDLPIVTPDQTVRDSLFAMTRGRCGLVIVQSEQRQLLGILTDGDLRRGLSASPDFLEKRVSEVMTSKPVTISADASLAEAEEKMKHGRLNVLIVLGADGGVVGLVEIFNGR